MSHHYAFVAAKLLNQCLEQIQGVIDMDEHSNRPHPSNSTFYDIKEALAEAERQLFRYFSFIIQKEVENSLSTQVQEIFEKDDPCFDLPSCVDFLHFVLRESSLAASNHAAHPTHSFYPRRSATDSLLFRLHVALQLCMVRIDDSRLAICGRSYREATAVAKTHAPSLFDMAIGMLGVTTVSVLYVQRSFNLKSSRSLAVYQPFFRNVAKTGVSLIVARWLHQKWSNLWMTAKLVKSIEEIEEWSRQWTLVQCTPAPRPPYKKVPSPSLATDKSNETLLNAAQSRRLIEYALHETTKVRIFCYRSRLTLYAFCVSMLTSETFAPFRHRSGILRASCDS